MFMIALGYLTCCNTVSTGAHRENKSTTDKTGQKEIIGAKRISMGQPRLVDKKLKKISRMIKCRKRYLSSLQDETDEETSTATNQDKQKNHANRHGVRTKVMSIPSKLLFLGTFLSQINKTACTHEADNTSSNKDVRSWNLLAGDGRKKSLHKGGTEPPEEKPKKTTEADKQQQPSQTITIISANVHSMRPRAEIIATWDADIILVQETKLAPHAISQTAATLKDYNWKLKHGKPCSPQTQRREDAVTHAANEANSGGVAILAKQPNYFLKCDNKEDDTIHDTGRWVEGKVPLKGNTNHLIVASVYGISGSSSDKKKEA